MHESDKALCNCSSIPNVPSYDQLSQALVEIPIRVFWLLVYPLRKICHVYWTSNSWYLHGFYLQIKLYIYMYIYNSLQFRMEYRHLTKMRGTKKLLWNWNISVSQLLMDCLICNGMKSCNKQWNTHLMSTPNSLMEFHWIATPRIKVPWNSMEF